MYVDVQRTAARGLDSSLVNTIHTCKPVASVVDFSLLCIFCLFAPLSLFVYYFISNSYCS